MNAVLNQRMRDGSRHFAELPQAGDACALRDHLLRLPGARLTAFVCDGVTEGWLDFTYQAHAFSVNDQLGAYWFFAADPACPEQVLEAVVAHFSGEWR